MKFLEYEKSFGFKSFHSLNRKGSQDETHIFHSQNQKIQDGNQYTCCLNLAGFPPPPVAIGVKEHWKIHSTFVGNYSCSFQEQSSLSGSSYLNLASTEDNIKENGHNTSRPSTSLLRHYCLQILGKMKSSLPLSQTEEMFSEGY